MQRAKALQEVMHKKRRRRRDPGNGVVIEIQKEQNVKKRFKNKKQSSRLRRSLSFAFK